MKRTKKAVMICFAAVIVSYGLGFIFVVPLKINARGIPRTVADGIHFRLYQIPISHLAQDNPIRKLWRANATFWCEHDDQCEVVEEPHLNKP